MLEAVCANHQPVIIVRRRGTPVVLMSLADSHSLQASLHWLDSETDALSRMAGTPGANGLQSGG